MRVDQDFSPTAFELIPVSEEAWPNQAFASALPPDVICDMYDKWSRLCITEPFASTLSSYSTTRAYTGLAPDQPEKVAISYYEIGGAGEKAFVAIRQDGLVAVDFGEDAEQLQFKYVGHVHPNSHEITQCQLKSVASALAQEFAAHDWPQTRESPLQPSILALILRRVRLALDS